MKNIEGKVYIIGAGPGDPELITVKGMRILKEADCLLYDFLSSPELLNYAKKNCEKICVGKADKLHLKEQNQINQLLYEKSLQYRLVVRLKGGDPFIFSRGYEEVKFLRKKEVEVEVVPGVTSAIAGPESFGIPLTIKNKISSVAIVTGRKHSHLARIQAPHASTLIYLMAVANIHNVVKALHKSGRLGNTPCAFIEKATLPDSRLIRATIMTAESMVKKYQIKPPAVFIVGNVVKKMIGKL